MKVANTEVAGLAGSLYETFEGIGLRFFRGLLGAVRADRLELEYTRVAVGGVLIGLGLGAAVGVLPFGLALAIGAEERVGLAGCGAIGFVIVVGLMGSLALLIVAGTMIHYVNSLRVEDVRSAAPPARGSRGFEEIFAERQKVNLDAGYPPRDALREAWWFARLTTGSAHGR